MKEYAILSHRWEAEEVSFKDMQDLESVIGLPKFAKIRASCKLALQNDYSYIWIDTCCINKESSAELSEAINSMFRWYKAAAVCYAYLSDVSLDTAKVDDIQEQVGIQLQVSRSTWFKRGWTLQELLAPSNVEFYSHQWDYIGSKTTFRQTIVRRAGIHEGALRGEPLSEFSIAERFSWASQRITTRPEDIAYCLLGIFDVNMPMLYGEGTKAFMRLQEEIIKQSDDHTIFAWPIQQDHQTGLLADSPAAFAECHHTKCVTRRQNHFPFSNTNRGLSCKFVTLPFIVDTYLVRIDCTNYRHGSSNSSEVSGLDVMAMFLRRLNEDDQYIRVRHDGETFQKWPSSELERSFRRHSQHDLRWQGHGWWRSGQLVFNVRARNPDPDSNILLTRFNGFRLVVRDIPVDAFADEVLEVQDCDWDAKNRTLSLKPMHFGYVGTVNLQLGQGIGAISLGFDTGYNPVCFVATEEGLKTSSSPFGASQSSDPKSMGIQYRSPFDTHAWSSRQGFDAFDLKSQTGLWALKGDRLNGLSASLWSNVVESHQASEYHADEGLRKFNIDVISIKRAQWNNRLIWEVHLIRYSP